MSHWLCFTVFDFVDRQCAWRHVATLGGFWAAIECTVRDKCCTIRIKDAALCRARKLK